MHNLKPKKHLGQHFLTDKEIAQRIVSLLQAPADEVVIEIGPGKGILTQYLLPKYPALQLIEVDPEAASYIEHHFADYEPRLTLTDVLKWDIPTALEGPAHFISNLPYNISSPVFFQLLENRDYVQEGVFMVQKEVAQRITAQMGDKAYGRLAILSQWLCHAGIAFDVPASAFAPPPKVTSSIVHLTPKSIGEDKPAFDVMEKITAAAFGQRRKMVRTSLKAYSEYFEACGIDPTWRAENLQICHFVDLAKNVKKAC